MKKIYLSILVLVFNLSYSQKQDSVLELSLNDVVSITVTRSPQFHAAKNKFLSSYWGYRYHQASNLPSVTLKMNPANLSSRKDVASNSNIETISSSGGLSIDQNVALTGGKISLNTNGDWSKNIDKSNENINVTFVDLKYKQSLFRFNDLAYNNKIEPLKFDIAKREFVKDLEQISQYAVNMYFNLASAKVNLGIQETNYHNNDTLLKISSGRFKMGKISKNELLQMELNKLNSQKNLKEAKLDLRSAEIKLIAFLGLKEIEGVKIKITDSIPNFKVLSPRVFQLTKENNPQYLKYKQRLLESNAAVDRASDGRYFSADVSVSVGYSKFNSEKFADIMTDAKHSETANLSLTIPILDWGRAEGRYKMAEFKDRLEKINIEKEKIEFEQNLDLFVRRFNMQESQLKITKKSNEIAQSKFDISKQRFLLGKITVIELDKARTEKDQAKRNHINTLKTFWKYYYDLRAYTLYDFEKQHSLLDEYSSSLIDN